MGQLDKVLVAVKASNTAHLPHLLQTGDGYRAGAMDVLFGDAMNRGRREGGV
jgi:hypothetical protein